MKCSLNVIGQIYLSAPPALKCLGTNVVGTKVYSAAVSGILSSGGLLHFDWLPSNRVIAHYYKVDLISTLLDALTVQDSPRLSHRLLLKMTGLPAILMLSPPAVWTHTNAPKAASSGKEWICIFIRICTFIQWAVNMLMFHVNMKRLGIHFKNDSFQWFRVDSFFWETITLHTVHFQI